MKLKLIALTITALLFSVRVFSAPYATTYTGNISSAHPDTVEGESFRLTLVMDNGGATAVSQNWGGGDLQCLIFEFNEALDVVFAVDLDAQPPSFVAGGVTTDAGGALIGIFSAVQDNSSFTGGYTATGFTDPNGSVQYFANNANGIFYDDAGFVDDAAGGIQMNVANWSAPSPYAGDCVARASASDAPATAVPALPMGGLVILAGLAGLFGVRKLRKAA